jgi:hypothetical protein
MPRFAAAVVSVAAAVLAPTLAGAQGLPTEPLSIADGRVVVGAEVNATFAGGDPGFFNYTDYEYSALRNLRFSVSAEARVSQRFQVLGEIRVDHGNVFEPFALYARIRPWAARRLDIQVGRIPPTFGLYGRGTYGTANLLIGTPLAYQYLTSLRPDALPRVNDDLIRMRGRGWLSNFPVGNLAADRGLPLVNSYRWDTGVQVHGVNGMLEWTGGVTTGSLSNPRVDDDNDGKQVAGRGVVRPMPALALGGSFARGAFLSDSLEGSLPEGRAVTDAVQQAVGVDAEYSQGRFLGRGEVIWAHWSLPSTAQSSDDTRLEATSVLAEARYRILPGVHLAARGERLGFGRIPTATGLLAWEAPVRRFEIGAGYAVVRNVIVKASWQRNLRDGGRVRRDTLGALQIIYWF